MIKMRLKYKILILNFFHKIQKIENFYNNFSKHNYLFFIQRIYIKNNFNFIIYKYIFNNFMNNLYI